MEEVRNEQKGEYFYPRPPRGGRHQRSGEPGCGGRISIHALREEGDADGGIWKLEAKKFLSTPSARRATRPCTRISTTPSDFYPRPPRGGRLAQSAQRSSVMRFLSTPSARRATRAIHGGETFQWNFYPRPPRGGRPMFPEQSVRHEKISIHALREEGDTYRLVRLAKFDEFLSTPSARRAT